MKIVQLNLWMGHLLHPVLKFVESESIDVLCAQEVLSSKEGHGLYDFYQTHERISELFPYHFFAPTYSFQALGQNCKYGNAIYSKYPIDDSGATFTVGEYSDDLTISSLKQSGEIRNLQHCSLITPSGTHLHIANHHGYHNTNFEGTPASEDSMRNAVKSLKSLSEPAIFCGDLNANPSSKTIRELDSLNMRNLSTEYALQSTLSPVHRFNFNLISDYIFVGSNIKLNSFEASNQVISDHKPLIAVVDI